ncbi:MAG TPA: sugar phosphate nucleotidyltransferase, partial [archaeon]|nr:sugar phosphate nucleotidyltransferase [archaeon]
IGALDYLVSSQGIDEDLIVIAGDNLFDFRLKELVNYYNKKKCPVIAFYDMQDLEAAKRFGVAELDKDDKVVDFSEKPETPKSTFVSTGCYIFPHEALAMISTYLKDKNNHDAPGYFISWLYKRLPVYGFRFKGKWYDIGSFEAYLEAEKEYKKRNRL